jgi:hypothetical protein
LKGATVAKIQKLRMKAQLASGGHLKRCDWRSLPKAEHKGPSGSTSSVACGGSAGKPQLPTLLFRMIPLQVNGGIPLRLGTGRHGVLRELVRRGQETGEGR